MEPDLQPCAAAPHRFYLSSPYLGLQKEREQAKQLIIRRYHAYLDSYGGKSVTELEFEAALESGRSLHAFLLNYVTDSRNGIERDPEAIKALEAFRQRVRGHFLPLECVGRCMCPWRWRSRRSGSRWKGPPSFWSRPIWHRCWPPRGQARC